MIASGTDIPDLKPNSPDIARHGYTESGFVKLRSVKPDASRLQSDESPRHAAALSTTSVPPFKQTREDNQVIGNDNVGYANPEKPALASTDQITSKPIATTSVQTQLIDSDTVKPDKPASAAPSNYNPLRPVMTNNRRLAEQRKQSLPEPQQVTFFTGPTAETVTGTRIDHSVFNNSPHSQLSPAPTGKKRYQPVPVIVNTPRHGLTSESAGDEQSPQQTLLPYPAITFPPGTSTSGKTKTAARP